MTKLCKDCKYHSRYGRYGIYSACTHPELQEPVNPVNGNPTTTFCDFERLISTGKCGPDAKYFEPTPVRKPWYQAIRDMFGM